MQRNGNFLARFDVGERLDQRKCRSTKVTMTARWDEDKSQWEVKNDYMHAYFWQSKKDRLKCDYNVVWTHPKYGKWAPCHFSMLFRLIIEEHLYMRGGRAPSFSDIKPTDIREVV